MRYKGLKGQAWIKVRQYVKAKEKNCYTCDKKNLEGINAQAGHYLPVGIVGSNNTLSWDERQIHLQCSRCNGAGQGEAVAYRIHLVEQYGLAVVQEMEARKYKVDPVKNWQTVIDHFQSLYETR